MNSDGKIEIFGEVKGKWNVDCLCQETVPKNELKQNIN